MNEELDKIAQLVHERLHQYNLKGRTITLKIKYSDFRQITRNRSFLQPVSDLDTIRDTAKQLLASTAFAGQEIRLLGITLSNFREGIPHRAKHDEPGQLRLFP